MTKGFLQACLAKGMCLEAIAKEVGKPSSTVGHWLKRHGLRANGAAKHTQRGAICSDELKVLVARGATLAEMADHFERSVSTIRYWLSRHEIESPHRRGARHRQTQGKKTDFFECKRPGATE